MINWIPSLSFSQWCSWPSSIRSITLWTMGRNQGRNQERWAKRGHMSMILLPLQTPFDSRLWPEPSQQTSPGYPPTHSVTWERPLVAEDGLVKYVQPPCGRGQHWKISRPLQHGLTMTGGIMITLPPNLVAAAPTRRIVMKWHLNHFSQIHKCSSW